MKKPAKRPPPRAAASKKRLGLRKRATHAGKVAKPAAKPRSSASKKRVGLRKRATHAGKVARPAAKRAAAPKRKPIVIDFHAHITVPEVEQYAAPHSVSRGGAARVPEHRFVTEEHRRQAADWIGKVRARMNSYDQRIKDMDEAGVDIQVLTLSLISHHTYWAGADEDKSAQMERLANDRMAEIIHKYPGRFIGLGGVPLHSLQFAVNELERCMGELGFKGVQVSSMAGDMELGDERLRPFWKRAEELGAAIYLHPAGVWDMRYAKHQLWNSIGQPLEEAMAMASLMYEGILDDFPNLNICVAHGGGFSPYYAGRLDRNYYDKPYLRLKMTRSPTEYLQRSFYYDTCVYNPEMLDTLVDKVGASRIVLGSDYPVGEEDPVGFILNSKKLSAKEKEDVLQNNAANMLGLAI